MVRILDVASRMDPNLAEIITIRRCFGDAATAGSLACGQLAAELRARLAKLHG
ncbi:hypothetical protein [Cryobacterium sp. GrIS_2_6]|uniref:hypothetical protein n=1 Tax=Cryobacterium sp. GrIS_2_6 TaxID=3162785 RepID=UPI002E08D573|nr:hypothetical protein [Cryobacterium psychrotolerans]